MLNYMSKNKLLKLQITISGEIIKGKMPNYYSYNENSDLSSKLSNFYIPSQTKLSKITNFDYKDLLDKKKVDTLSKDNNIDNLKSLVRDNVEFLVKKLFKINNKFYVKCDPYIINKDPELKFNSERELFIKNTRKKYKKIKDLIQEDNKNEINELKQRLLGISDNKTLTDDDNMRIKEKQIELFDNFKPDNIINYANIKILELDKESEKLQYNLRFKLNTTNNGIDVIEKSENEIYFSLILYLTKEEKISNVKYHKNCKDNYQQINNMWNQFCDGENGYIEKMEKNKLNDNLENINKILNRKNKNPKNKNPKNNLLYLMCRDRIPQNKTYKKSKVIDIYNLENKCSIKGGKLTKKSKYNKKKRTRFKLKSKKKSVANKNRLKSKRNKKHHKYKS